MDHEFCPGSKLLRQPAPEFFTCPNCGEEVEIWTDEFKRNCLNCGKAVYKDAGMSCLDWCKHGKECVGDSVYDSYMKNKSVGIRNCLLQNLRKHIGNDKQRVAQAEKVLKNAESLLKSERGEWHIVIPASILRDLGRNDDVADNGDHDPVDGGKTGTALARDLLLRQGLRINDIDEICTIIGQPTGTGRITTDNSRVLHDAEELTTWTETCDGKSDEEISSLIEERFLTDAGREMARERAISRVPAR